MGRDFYASPVGSPAAAGTIIDPWDLQTAFDKTTLQPGDTVWLRAGTYTHSPQGVITGNEGYIFQISISGSTAGQITFRGYPSERASIDGGAFAAGIFAYHANTRPTVNVGNSGNAAMGNFITLQDLELFSSSKEARTSIADSSFPLDIARSDGPYVFGTGAKIINCVIHDTTAGISAWKQSKLAEIYGCLFFNCGWQGNPHAHGHGIYTQNNFTGSQTKTIKRNILAGAYDKNIQMYGSSDIEVSRFRFLENIAIGSAGRGGVLIGTRNGGLPDRCQDNQVNDNIGFGADLSLYYQPDDAAYKDLVATGNYFVDGQLAVANWKQGTFTGNTFISPTLAKILSLWPNTGGVIPPWVMDKNSYVISAANSQAFTVESEAPRNIGAWKLRTGFEANSLVSALLPTTTKIVLQDNIYDANRGQLAIFNWANAAFVAVNLAALGWAPGSTVVARNAQDYFGDVKTLTVTASGTILVDMQNGSHSVAVPNGAIDPIIPNSFPRFGAFILQKTGAAPTPPPPPPPVVTPPIITAQPISWTVLAGANVTFSVVASGSTPLSYQWKVNGSPIPGAVNPSLALTSVTAAMTGGSYTVDVSNSASTVTSNAAILTVSTPAPPPPVLTPLQILDGKIVAAQAATSDAQTKATMQFIRDLLTEVQKL